MAAWFYRALESVSMASALSTALTIYPCLWTVNVSPTVFDILTFKDRKWLVFPPLPCFTPPCGGTPCDINVIYTPLKSTFNGLQFRRWQYGSIFIRLAVIVSETREMSRNSKKIWPYTSSSSSKVINLGVNQKLICDCLLVTNSNFGRICYRFRDIDV